MKNKKWLWITLATLLTIMVLFAVAGAGFRLGLTQNAAFMQRQDMRAQNFNKAPQQKSQQNSTPGQKQNAQDPNSGNWMADPHGQGFDPRNNSGHGFNPRFKSNRGFDHARGGFVTPLFGLVRLAFLGALLWFGYQYIQKSGWKLIREVPTSTPAVEQTESIEEKTDEA